MPASAAPGRLRCEVIRAARNTAQRRSSARCECAGGLHTSIIAVREEPAENRSGVRVALLCGQRWRSRVCPAGCVVRCGRLRGQNTRAHNLCVMHNYYARLRHITILYFPYTHMCSPQSLHKYMHTCTCNIGRSVPRKQVTSECGAHANPSTPVVVKSRAMRGIGSCANDQPLPLTSVWRTTASPRWKPRGEPCAVRYSSCRLPTSRGTCRGHAP